MPRGYRHILTALAGIATLFTALGVGSFFGSLYAPNHKQYGAVGGGYSTPKDYDGPSKSLPDISGLPGSIERAIANPTPSTGQDHEKRDLAAQEASAMWAFWMLVVTGLSTAVTLIGTILLYQQIILTRKAVEDTGDATEVMRKANEISQHSLEIQWRPDLAIEMVGPYREKIRDGGFNGVPHYYTIWGLTKITNRSDFAVFITETHMAVGHDRFGDFSPGLPQEQFYELPAASECYSYRGVLVVPTQDDLPRFKFGIGVVNETDVGQYYAEPPYIYGYVACRDPLGIIRKTHYAFRPESWSSQGSVRYGGDRLNYDEKIERQRP